MFQPLLDAYTDSDHLDMNASYQRLPLYWSYPKTPLLKSIAKLIKNPYPCYAP